MPRSMHPMPALTPEESESQSRQKRINPMLQAAEFVRSVSALPVHRAGWSVGDVPILTAEGPAWLVSGTNGENAVNARGATQAEAWHRACQQAEAAGMLRRKPSTARA